MVDLASTIKADPFALEVQASGGHFLTGQSVEVQFPACCGSEDFGQSDLDEAQLVDGEFGASVGHWRFLRVVDGVRMNALFPKEAKSNLRVCRIFL